MLWWRVLPVEYLCDALAGVGVVVVVVVVVDHVNGTVGAEEVAVAEQGRGGRAGVQRAGHQRWVIAI